MVALTVPASIIKCWPKAVALGLLNRNMYEKLFPVKVCVNGLKMLKPPSREFTKTKGAKSTYLASSVSHRGLAVTWMATRT